MRAKDYRDDVEVGTCEACGQTLLRTATDCWHPWTVRKACPPEVPDAAGLLRPRWGKPLHPGMACFRPLPRVDGG